MSINLSKLYGKNIMPSCKYCLYFKEEVCEKEQDTANGSCKLFRYEPTMREPKTLPLLSSFKPEDFQI